MQHQPVVEHADGFRLIHFRTHVFLYNAAGLNAVSLQLLLILHRDCEDRAARAVHHPPLRVLGFKGRRRKR